MENKMIIDGYEIKPFADLRGADLYKANLLGAKLIQADLYKANLRGADLYKANLHNANIKDCIGN
jgi:uncharacterized protein YjbI with pentapeptide repeats